MEGKKETERGVILYEKLLFDRSDDTFLPERRNYRWRLNMAVVIERPNGADIERRGIRSWPIWEKEISTFPWFYDEPETCYFLEGEVTVTDTKTGVSYEIKKGDLVTFPAGFSCRWEIRRPVKKHYRFG